MSNVSEFSFGRSLLMTAIDGEKTKFATRLLSSSQVDLSAKDKSGKTALHYAVEKGYSNLVKRILLTASGEGIGGDSERSGNDGGDKAGGGGKSAGRALWSKSAVSLVRCRDLDGVTAFHLACSSGSNAAIAALLQVDAAEIGAPDAAGWSPLHRAAFGGFEEVVDLLLECGVADDGVTKEGFTPFSLAKSEEMKRLFLQKVSMVVVVVTVVVVALIMTVGTLN